MGEGRGDDNDGGLAMPDQFAPRATDRWTITEQGKLDLATAVTCKCDPHLAGLLIACSDCGTVYGSVRDSAVGAYVRDRKVG
jgi:hypothetical protein